MASKTKANPIYSGRNNTNAELFDIPTRNCFDTDTELFDTDTELFDTDTELEQRFGYVSHGVHDMLLLGGLCTEYTI